MIQTPAKGSRSQAPRDRRPPDYALEPRLCLTSRSVRAIAAVALTAVLAAPVAGVGPVPSLRAAVAPQVLQAQKQRIETIRRIAPSVVAIFARGAAGGGSGVLVTPDGFALTNFHVVAAAGSFMKCGLNDGNLYDAVIVGVDPTGDVALIKLLGRDDFPCAELGDSDTVHVGDWVFALGNPFLLATDFQPTVTYGMVSGVHRYQYPAGTVLEYADCIQVDASINPGNSGGPLFDSRGLLIGINGRISTGKRGRVNSGVGYAISINQIKNFWDHLRSGRIVDHATLGATVRTQSDGTIIVDSILETSDAYRRGLRLGDEIVSFAQRPIRSVNQFKNILGIFPQGWKVPLVYRRDGRKHPIVVRLERLHKDSSFARRRRPVVPPHGRRPRRPSPDRPQPKSKPPDHSPQPDGQPRRLPFPIPRHPAKPPPIPEKYKHLYVEKDGFANFYFNQVEQDRLTQALRELGDFLQPAGPWRLSGQDGTGKRFELTVTNQAVGLEWGEEAFYLDGAASEVQDEPPASGGFLVAMSHWRQLLALGPKSFTECYYLGSEPLDATDVRVDVLVTLQGSIETHWYFRRDPDRLVGFDTWLAPHVDPCEVRFDRFQETDGRRWPEALRVRHGDSDFATFRVKEIKLGPK
ncbi:MAG: trypsin-like serine protease [Planctomycetes bacterium]|nr:trypsin-like serine protease [Planctomycetota bacterium]